MTDHVWICRAISDTSNYRSLTNDLAEDHKDRAIDSDKRNELGEALGAEYFPSRIWPSDEIPDRGLPLGDLFFANSVWVVSGRCADVLRGFDLGHGNLYPVSVMGKDGAPIAGRTFFCINFGNRKQALLPEHSASIRKTFNDYYRLKGVFNDDDIAVSSSATSGPDIWIDPLIYGAFFLNSRLHDALIEAGTVSGFGEMKRCRVVHAG